MVFKRRRNEPDDEFQADATISNVSYATTSDVAPEPYAEYPNRPPDAAALHERQYNEQRERLNAFLARTGQSDELFVAKVFAVRRPDGGVHTYTTWTEGVNTLLPAADVILLVEQPVEQDADPVMTRVRWNVVASVCADDCWVVMPELKPLRIRTRAWPQPDQLAELKAKSLRTT